MAASVAPAPKKAATSSAPARWRRFAPWWLLALVGAGIAAFYGLAIEHLRWSPPFVMLCLGGAALGWASSALWSVLAPLVEGLPDDERVAAEIPHHRRELEREKQLVLKAIKEVELDFQMRKIAPEDYKAMSERYRARALRLIAELDAGDDVRALIERELKLRLAAVRAAEGAAAKTATKPETKQETKQEAKPETKQDVAQAAPPASTTCASCGTVNDPDAVFCKKCGTKTGTGSGAP